jgi:hypothetical protein
MRHVALVFVLIVSFALGATTAVANDNNDNRIGRADPPVTTSPTADGVPCSGLYTAGVGNPPFSGPDEAPSGAAADTPGYTHVFENDEEMCHFR